MDKNKIVKIVIAILIIIIIIIAIILGMLNHTDSSQVGDPPQDAPEDLVVDTTIQDASVTNDYFAVKDILIKYNSYCRKLNMQATDVEVYRQAINEEELRKYKEETALKEKDKATEAIYSMLDTSYINEFNITKENIQQKFGIHNEVETVIETMYVVQNSLNVSTYFVSGTCIDTEASQKTEFSCAVSLDMLNNTFSICPQEYLQKHGYSEVKVGDSIDINIESIENKNYNTFEYKFIEDNAIAMEYFNNYKYTMLYNVDKAYEMLDKTYREKRFGSLEEYKKYVQENYNSLSKCVVSKYQVEEVSGAKNYVCLDNFENYYVFKQNNISNYTLTLDTYTIESEKFTKEYNSATISTKVQMNIDKFIQMINAKDYKNSYNLLYDGFKNNYFQTEEAYKQYMKSSLFEYNTVTYDKFSNEGETYIYELTVSDKTGASTETKKLTVIMKLMEGTNFVMSFSIG